MKAIHALLAGLTGLCLCANSGFAQFGTLKPTLLQPRSPSRVVVPVAPLSGFDFDWSDVSGATHYEIEVTRHLMGGGTQIGTATSTESRILYSSDVAPLEAGTIANPNMYSWRVTAFQGETPSMSSTTFSFELVGGTPLNPPKPAPGANPLAPPSNLIPVLGVQFTPSGVNRDGLVMSWSPVATATGYEVQLVRARDSEGTSVENLHYRLDVSGPQAVVSNLTLFGQYRFEVRTIGPDGSRSNAESIEMFNLVNFLASDLFPPSPDPDGRIDEFDLFTLARNWHYPRISAPNPFADIVSQDAFVNQADLIAFLIQFHGASLPFPPPGPTPTPAPLDPPQLNLPFEAQMVTLASQGDSLVFSWSPVTNAENYTLCVRNTTTSQAEFFQTMNTEQAISGNTFFNLYGAGGDFTWEVTASAIGFEPATSAQRSFNLVLGFTKSGKSTPSGRPFWNRVTDILLGEPASAQTPEKGAVEPPVLVFPYKAMCLATNSAIPIVWEEVPGATSYALEITLKVGSSTVFLDAVGTTRDGENLNIITDLVPGDGLVAAGLFSTFRSPNYRIRVQARMGGTRGEFSLARRFEINQLCPAVPDLPFTDIDFAEDGDFEGNDFLVFSEYWHSTTAGPNYNALADLAPGTPDGTVDAKDLLEYRGLFAMRNQLPKSIPLPPPVLETPEDGTFFAPEAQGIDIEFSWIPQDNSFADPAVWEIEVTLPNGSPKSFYSGVPSFSTQFVPEGTYSWRVRTLSDDGTRGEWSNSRVFLVELAEFQPTNPIVFGPADNAVLQAGALQFEWERVTRAGLFGVFDRIEIQNGDGPIFALDIWHRESEAGMPRVVNSIPVALNHGPEFRWRVRTYYIIRDTFLRLFPYGSVEDPDWHPFTLQGNPNQLGGLGSWNWDQNFDGGLNVPDLGLIGKSWKSGRDTNPAFKFETDLDFDGFTTQLDLFKALNAFRDGVHLVTNGFSQPIPTFPVEHPVNGPPNFPVTTSAVIVIPQGLNVQWNQVPGATKYVVEWVDAENTQFGMYAEKLPAPELITPTGGQMVNLPAVGNGVLTFMWSGIPNADSYSMILTNLSTGKSSFPYIVEALNPNAPNVSLQVPVQDLVTQTGGAGNYEWRVQPFARGFFADTSVFEMFSLSFSKDMSDYYSMSHPLSDLKARPGIVVPGQSVILPFGFFGLHAWRVIALDGDLTISRPSRWNKFGVHCLGPAYGGDEFCGQ